MSGGVPNKRPKWKAESGRLTAWRTTLGEHIEKREDGYHGIDRYGQKHGTVGSLIEITTLIESTRIKAYVSADGTP